MLIYCTKKMLEETMLTVSATASKLPETDPLYAWHGHIIMINRKKTLVLICSQNRYVVMLYGLKAKDFKQLDARIAEAIRDTLLKEQINPAVVERYMAEAGTITYAKNSDRKQTARLNKACEVAALFGKDLNSEYDNTFGTRLSRVLVGASGDDYFYPNKQMIADLERYGMEQVRKYPVFELTARLDLGSRKRDAIRKLAVSRDITFLELHKILQSAFGWLDGHLFDFWLIEKKNQRKPSVEIVASEEDLEYADGDVLLSESVKLSDYLSQYKHLLYHYDFGDDWCHHIEVTGVIDDYAEQPPVLISGKGNTPPEDVGGIGGYEYFLQAIGDPEHEEHKTMLEWGEEQGYSEFDLEKARQEIKYALEF